jgi:HD-like signal output (HDOD) protein
LWNVERLTMAISALILSSVDEQIKMLSVAPQILPKLQTLIEDANTNPDDILDLIRLDSAMAARMIKTSNTAYFSPGFRITNIEDAVTYLGYDEVYRVVCLLAFSQLMRNPLRSFGLNAGDLWRRSLACALAMNGLAPLLVQGEKRTAYTIGLLHSVGMVFVDKQLSANKAPPATTPIDEREVRLLGVTHAEVGAYVLRQWNFPEEIVEPIRCQFEPLDCLAHGKLACLLHVGRCIMQDILYPPADGQPGTEPDPLVMTMLNLPMDEYREIFEETEGKFTLLEIATSDI